MTAADGLRKAGKSAAVDPRLCVWEALRVAYGHAEAPIRVRTCTYIVRSAYQLNLSAIAEPRLPSLPFCSLPEPSGVPLFAVLCWLAKPLPGIARRDCGAGPGAEYVRYM